MLISVIFDLVTLKFIIDYIIEWGPLAIIIIFQPEIRNVLEQLGEMELLTPNRFPHLHQWSLNLLQTSPVNDCLPPRDSVVDYFGFGFNYFQL